MVFAEWGLSSVDPVFVASGPITESDLPFRSIRSIGYEDVSTYERILIYLNLTLES